MVWMLKYIRPEFPKNLKLVLHTYATKEEALASIPQREELRKLDNSVGKSPYYTGPVIWIVEQVGAVEAAQLVTKVREAIHEEVPPYFIR